MKRLILAAFALALVASCREKTTCPTCPVCEKCPPLPEPCPEGECDVKLDDGSTAATWRLVTQKDEKTGQVVKAFMTATLPDKRVLAVPVALDAQIYVDGKQASGGEVLLGPGGGSCPCIQPRCLPYCRPIGELLLSTTPTSPTPP